VAIKLAICGTHSTGKTSLLQRVESSLRDGGYDVGRVADLAVKAKELGFPILREHTFASTLWIMTRGINLELEAELKSDIILVDRPVVDALGYLLAALRQRGSSVAHHEMEYLRSRSKQHAFTYHKIFKTVIDQEKEIDNTKPRDLDPVFRQQVDDTLNRLFSDLEIPFEPLNTDPNGALEQVLKQALELLNNSSSEVK